jgi:uncharacterized protein (DUF697 family)
MTPEARSIITRTDLLAAGLGVILSPIPLVDELILPPLWLLMTARIARAQKTPLLSVPWGRVSAVALGGLTLRFVVNAAVSVLPGIAAVVNATTAVALTEIVGRTAAGSPASSGESASPVAVPAS